MNKGNLSCFEVPQGHDAENFKLIGSSLQAYVTLSGIFFLSPTFICFLGFCEPVSHPLPFTLKHTGAPELQFTSTFFYLLRFPSCFPSLLKSKPSLVSLLNKRKTDPEHLNEDMRCIHKPCKYFWSYKYWHYCLNYLVV